MEKTKHVVIKNSIIKDTLASKEMVGKRLLEPLKSFSGSNKVPLNILEDKEVSNDAEVHMHEADLWQCLEGKVTFVCGGEMVNPWFKQNQDGSEDKREVKAKEIKNGEKIELERGDWLWIPAGIPHQHICSGTARLSIIKIPKV